MKRHLIIQLAAIVTLLAGAAQAASGTDWTCRNTEMEITCDKGACTISKPGEFTPMSVTLKAQTLSVCAYSGCWDAKATTVSNENLVYAFSQSMKWSSPGDDREAAFQLALNTMTKLAVLLGEGFAHPLHCNPAK